MTEQEKEDLVRLKMLVPEIQKSLTKILDNQEVLAQIKMEVEDNKNFRARFTSEVTELVAQRLNTVQFEKDLNAQIEKQTQLYLNRQDVRDDFVNKVKNIFQIEFKYIQLGLYLKLTAVVGAVATGLATFILKGVIGG